MRCEQATGRVISAPEDPRHRVRRGPFGSETPLRSVALSCVTHVVQDRCQCERTDRADTRWTIAAWFGRATSESRAKRGSSIRHPPDSLTRSRTPPIRQGSRHPVAGAPVRRVSDPAGRTRSVLTVGDHAGLSCGDVKILAGARQVDMPGRCRAPRLSHGRVTPARRKAVPAASSAAGPRARIPSGVGVRRSAARFAVQSIHPHCACAFEGLSRSVLTAMG